MSEFATLDTTGFNRMIGDLVRIGGPGTNADAALRGEVGKLLGVCVKYTPVATPAKIRDRANYRFNEKYAIRGSGDLKVTMNDGSRGGDDVADRVWLRSGGKWHIMRGPGVWAGGKRTAPGGAHWPDWLWAQYQSLIDQTPEERAKLKKAWTADALKSRGLAKESWAQAGEALGTPIPHYAPEAKASNRVFYQNGDGRVITGPDELTYQILNMFPPLTPGGRLDGEGIATRAINTRLTAFDIAMEKGIFADIEQVAKRYPGLLSV